MSHIQQITLDLIPNGEMPILYASQYDAGRSFRANIVERKIPYTLDGTELISLTVRKGDGNLVTMDIANTFADKTYIDFLSTEQMTAVSGSNFGELHLESNGVSIGTLNFYLMVEPAADEGGVTSHSEINNLERQIDERVDVDVADIMDDYYKKSETYSAEEIDNALDLKANASDVYDKTEIDTALALKANTSDVNTALALKADKATTYNKTEVDNLVSPKADKSYVDSELATKADKTYVDSALATKADNEVVFGGSETLSKAKISELIAYADKPVSADSAFYGKNITSALPGGQAPNSNLYKIDIENAVSITYPLYITSVSNGSVITDKDGMILKGYYNKTEVVGTPHTISCEGLPTAKYFYFGTNATLEEMDYSVVVNKKGLTDKLNDLIEDNNLIVENAIMPDWVQGNVPPSGASHTDSSTRCHTNPIIYNGIGKYLRIFSNGKKLRATFWSSYDVRNASTLIATDSNTNWTSNELLVEVPTNAKSFALSCAYINDATITPANCSDVFVTSIDNTLVNEFKNKVISILGDSISTYAGDNATDAGDGHKIADGTWTYAGNHCRYPNAFITNVNQTYWKQLLDVLGMKYGVNESWAGSRVSWNGSEGSDVGANIYIASQTRINHLGENGTPDYILVNAGTNDIGGGVTIGTFDTTNPVNYTDAQIAALPVATFADAYRALLIRLQKTYPLAQIVVMLPNYTTSYYNPTTADAYLEVIKEACDYFGVPYIDMRTSGITMFNTGAYMGDGIHPNPKGMYQLFNKVFKYFKNTL